MEKIRLATWINAPVERCFLLSLSIDLHVASARKAAVDGIQNGLAREGETVTFPKGYFGPLGPKEHTARIEALRPYSYFRDVMISGPFRYFEHDHHFAAMDDGTRMRDEIRFSVRWGLLARTLARKRLIAFLTERNAVMKRVAESEEWRKYLKNGMEIRTAAPAPGSTAIPWDRNALLQISQRLVVPPPNR